MFFIFNVKTDRMGVVRATALGCWPTHTLFSNFSELELALRVSINGLDNDVVPEPSELVTGPRILAMTLLLLTKTEDTLGEIDNCVYRWGKVH